MQGPKCNLPFGYSTINQPAVRPIDLKCLRSFNQPMLTKISSGLIRQATKLSTISYHEESSTYGIWYAPATAGLSPLEYWEVDNTYSKGERYVQDDNMMVTWVDSSWKISL